MSYKTDKLARHTGVAVSINYKQGSMVVGNASEEVREIFEVTGFADILTIE